MQIILKDLIVFTRVSKFLPEDREFILLIYYASNSINAILVGFNESYHIEERGNIWVIRIASLILIFVLGLFMMLAVGMIIFSGVVFSYLTDAHIVPSQAVFLLEVMK